MAGNLAAFFNSQYREKKKAAKLPANWSNKELIYDVAGINV